jgi:hypothetical protein
MDRCFPYFEPMLLRNCSPPHSNWRVIFLLVSMVLAPLSIYAESAAPSESEEASELTKVIECSYVYWDDMLDDEFYFRIGDVYYPMKFLRNKRSKVVSVARMEEFEMFRKVDKPLEGEDLYEFVAETIVPHDARRILFLVIAPNQEDEDYRVFALDDSSLVFGRRTFRFVNLTQQMISVEFAGETQQVDVDGVVVMESNVDEKGGFVPCIMRDPEGGTIYGTRLFAQPNGREDVFIRPSPIKGRKAPSIKFISQFIAIAPVENKQ